MTTPPPAPGVRPAFVYRHVVSFEETNLVGNVYFARYVSWQGRCREFFLKECAPSVLDDLSRDLRLVTLRVSCDYYEELRALDEVDVHMRLQARHEHRIGMKFDYARPNGTVVAQGTQDIGCMRLGPGGLSPVAPPRALADALARYS